MTGWELFASFVVFIIGGLAIYVGSWDDQDQVSQRQVDHSEQPAPYKIEAKE